MNQLTFRESEVHELMLEGRTNRQIGNQLGCTPATVKVHVSRVIHKLGGVSPRTIQDKSAAIAKLKQSIEDSQVKLAKLEKEHELYLSLQKGDQSVTL